MTKRDIAGRIIKFIDGEAANLAEFLSEYIRLRSVNEVLQRSDGKGYELEAQEWMAERLKGFGVPSIDKWAVDEGGVRPNVVATLPGKGGGRDLILNGHVDVVPVPEDQRNLWTVDPWSGEVSDGMVWGRGASDMKGGIVAAVWALRALMASGVDLCGSVHLEMVVGEESYQSNLGTLATLERGYRAPFAIVCEPTSCEVHPVSAGICSFELRIEGRGAHVASRGRALYPQRFGLASGDRVGVDAIAKMIPFLELFQRLEAQWNQRWQNDLLGSGGWPEPDKQGVGVFGLNPSTIHGGTYPSSLPSWCAVSYRVLHPPMVTSDEVFEEILRCVQALASTDDWLREHPPVLVRGAKAWPPSVLSPTHEGCLALAKAWQTATTKPAVFSGFRAVCDATHLNSAGVPTAICGPGDLDHGVHGVNEHVPTADVVSCAKAYALMAIEWCGVASCR